MVTGYNYFRVIFFTTKHLFHSTKLVEGISKIRDLLPNVPNPLKFGRIAHHIQQHKKLKCFSQREFLLTILPVSIPREPTREVTIIGPTSSLPAAAADGAERPLAKSAVGGISRKRLSRSFSTTWTLIIDHG